MSRTTQPVVLALSTLTLTLMLVSGRVRLPAQETESGSKPVPPKAEGAVAPKKDSSSAEKDSAGADLPPGVLAIVNGREITIDEYVGYLLASVGKSRLDEYINRLLLDEEARQLAVSVTPQEVEAAVEDRIQRVIKSLYLGKREGYLADLQKRHSDLESEKARLRQELYYDMLRDKVVLAKRKVTDEAVRHQFERVYGEGGVQHVLRHILISTRGRRVASEEKTGGSSGKIVRRSPGEARTRADKILKEIRGGLDFTQAVKQYSDDSFTRANQGRIPNYRKGAFGGNFDSAVRGLTQESPISGVVESPRGYHILQLIEKRTTEFEDVKADIEESVKNRPPSAEERQTLIQGLRKKARIQGS